MGRIHSRVGIRRRLPEIFGERRATRLRENAHNVRLRRTCPRQKIMLFGRYGSASRRPNVTHCSRTVVNNVMTAILFNSLFKPTCCAAAPTRHQLIVTLFFSITDTQFDGQEPQSPVQGRAGPESAREKRTHDSGLGRQRQRICQVRGRCHGRHATAGFGLTRVRRVKSGFDTSVRPRTTRQNNKRNKSCYNL